MLFDLGQNPLRIPMKVSIETRRALLVSLTTALSRFSNTVGSSLTRFSNSSFIRMLPSFERCSFLGATRPLIMSRRRVSIWSDLGSPSSAKACTNVTRNFPLTLLVGPNGLTRLPTSVQRVSVGWKQVVVSAGYTLRRVSTNRSASHLNHSSLVATVTI